MDRKSNNWGLYKRDAKEIWEIQRFRQMVETEAEIGVCGHKPRKTFSHQ